MSATGTFAFLVHPRGQLAQDMGRVFPPLGHVPDRWYDVALRRLPVPPVAMATVHLGADRAPVGHVVLVPFGARHILERPSQARDKIWQAVDRAVDLGASMVGLGALTSPATAGGAALRSRHDIGVTNGNAFTAAIVHDQVRQLLGQTGGGDVAVVGATGSVGTTVARLVARERGADRLTLVARNERRIIALADELRRGPGRALSVRTSTELETVRDCDLVVLLTAAAGSVLGPRHLGPNAVVLDATQPRNTSPSLGDRRPDVLVVDGGIVEVPSLRIRGGNVGLPDGRAYACFAETALLALAGHRSHFTIGVPTLAQVDHVREVAADFADLGFTVAPPSSFGRPLVLSTPPAVA